MATTIDWPSKKGPLAADVKPFALDIASTRPRGTRLVLRTPDGEYDLSTCIAVDMTADISGDSFPVLNLQIPLFLVDITMDTRGDNDA